MTVHGKLLSEIDSFPEKVEHLLFDAPLRVAAGAFVVLTPLIWDAPFAREGRCGHIPKWFRHVSIEATDRPIAGKYFLLTRNITYGLTGKCRAPRQVLLRGLTSLTTFRFVPSRIAKKGEGNDEPSQSA